MDAIKSIIPESIQSQITKILSLFRFRAFDDSTSEGRANERLRRVIWTAISTAVAKGINTLTILVTVPLTLGYLGSERYGLWMAISSFTAFLGFADLGIGNGVVNVISKAIGEKDDQTIKKCISSSFILLLQISLFFIVVYGLIRPYIHWDNFFNTETQLAKQEIGPAVTVFVISFLANIPLSIIARIQSGYQEGYINSFWQAVSNILGLVGILLIISMKAGLPWLVLILGLSPIVGNLANGVHLLVFRRPILFPKIKYVDFKLAKQIIGIGLLFFFLQIANAIMYSSDNIIIIKTLGSEAVTTYSVPSKLFVLIPNILYMGLVPLWPAYSEAHARGDRAWVKKTLYRSILLSFCISFIVSFGLIIFGKSLLLLWVGSKVLYSTSLMIALGIWTVLNTVISAACMFLNAVNKIMFQVICSLLTAVASIIIKVVFAQSLGLSGIVWAGVVCYLLLMVIPYFIFIFKQLTQIPAAPFDSSEPAVE